MLPTSNIEWRARSHRRLEPPTSTEILFNRPPQIRITLGEALCAASALVSRESRFAKMKKRKEEERAVTRSNMTRRGDGGTARFRAELIRPPHPLAAPLVTRTCRTAYPLPRQEKLQFNFAQRPKMRLLTLKRPAFVSSFVGAASRDADVVLVVVLLNRGSQRRHSDHCDGHLSRLLL